VRIETRPFSDADLGEAAALLAERHRRHRRTSQLLSPRFEDPQIALGAVRVAWAAPGAAGSVATRGGEVLGYLLGAPRSPARTWGPNTWVESAGTAVRDGEPEVSRHLYAEAAGPWVEAGGTEHYVLLPAAEERVVRDWFRLGFGHQHTHAARPLPTEPSAPSRGIELRVAERQDVPVLALLEVELSRHQKAPPSFAVEEVPDLAETEREYHEDFDDPSFHIIVAERDGTVVGAAVCGALTESDANLGLVRPDDAGFLGFAAVLPEARGLGVGRALGEAVLHWAVTAGYTCLTTDYRQANLQSSRAWPALGFEETFLRLHRTIRR
jgi:ribosomal protein S18 acetylase RimI-like enzyme